MTWPAPPLRWIRMGNHLECVAGRVIFADQSAVLTIARNWVMSGERYRRLHADVAAREAARFSRGKSRRRTVAWPSTFNETARGFY